MEIRQNWKNARLSGAFSGLSGFMQNRKKWKDKKVVERELQKLRGFALHRPIRIKFRRNKIWAHYSNAIWGADLWDCQKFARFNNNYRFVLFVIDSFSKFLYTVPVKNKSSSSMVPAFQKVFRMAKAKPRMLHVDNGIEFYSNVMKDFFKRNGIKVYSIHSIFKSAICERVIRTLVSKIYRFMTEKDTKEFIKQLQPLTAAYNSSYHRSIGMAPRQVTKAKWQEVWKRLYSKYSSQRGHRKPKYSEGDYVRISKEKARFEKSYTSNFSPEVFEIRAVLNTIIPAYLLRDITDKREDLSGAFYEEVRV